MRTYNTRQEMMLTVTGHAGGGNYACILPLPELEEDDRAPDYFYPLGTWRVLGPAGLVLQIIASDGTGWQQMGLPEPAWEHVSVSTSVRTPTWEEMEWVRDRFWEPEDLVFQFSIPRSQHINVHPNTLHLWKPVGMVFPNCLPPNVCV